MALSRVLWRAALALFLFGSPAWAFDYDRFTSSNLDEVMRARPPIASGVDVIPPQKLRFTAVLARQPEPCDAVFLKKVMTMAGVPQNVVDSVPISKCIQLRSAGGKTVTMYIQDAVADFLVKEVAVGGRVTVYVDFLFVGQDGPGFLVSEFQATK